MSKLILSLSFLLLSFSSFAQLTVRGQVLDSETNTPLVGANVFIAGSTYGVVTNAEGKFEITKLLDRHYSLVVSFVGYETQTFDFVPSQSISYQVMLKPSVNVLDEVVVKSRNQTQYEWMASYQDFRNHFIGISENAPNCTIKNPKALSFNVDGDEFTASVDSVLVIRNTGLGYVIKVHMQTYSFNKKTNIVHYEGPMMYQPLKAKNKRKEIRWAKNRLKAYYGSQMHFMRALYNQRLREEGFYVTMENAPLPSDTTVTIQTPVFGRTPQKLRTMTDYKQLVRSVDGKKVLSINGSIVINYVYEAEPNKYQYAKKMPYTMTFQVSSMQSLEPAIISSDGGIYPISSVEASGYWGWELMAEALPLDYDPAIDLEIIGQN